MLIINDWSLRQEILAPSVGNREYRSPDLICSPRQPTSLFGEHGDDNKPTLGHYDVVSLSWIPEKRFGKHGPLLRTEREVVKLGDANPNGLRRSGVHTTDCDTRNSHPLLVRMPPKCGLYPAIPFLRIRSSSKDKGPRVDDCIVWRFLVPWMPSVGVPEDKGGKAGDWI